MNITMEPEGRYEESNQLQHHQSLTTNFDHDVVSILMDANGDHQ